MSKISGFDKSALEHAANITDKIWNLTQEHKIAIQDLVYERVRIAESLMGSVHPSIFFIWEATRKGMDFDLPDFTGYQSPTDLDTAFWDEFLPEYKIRLYDGNIDLSYTDGKDEEFLIGYFNDEDYYSFFEEFIEKLNQD